MSDGAPSDRPGRKPSAAATALRSIALALLGSLLFGFAVGLWLRCQAEKPKPPMLGTAPASTPPHVGA